MKVQELATHFWGCQVSVGGCWPPPLLLRFISEEGPPKTATSSTTLSSRSSRFPEGVSTVGKSGNTGPRRYGECILKNVFVPRNDRLETVIHGDEGRGRSSGGQGSNGTLDSGLSPILSPGRGTGTHHRRPDGDHDILGWVGTMGAEMEAGMRTTIMQE